MKILRTVFSEVKFRDKHFAQMAVHTPSCRASHVPYVGFPMNI